MRKIAAVTSSILASVLVAVPWSTASLAQTVPVEVDPVWSSGPANNSYSVAPADLDRDGDLDLIFANFDGVNTIYFNNGGSIASIPWTFTPANRSSTVAVGDLNGDGFPDAVFGNYQQPNTIYINEGGRLPRSPTNSTAASENTYQIVLCDLDGDGDLDIVCANYDEPNRAYLNDGGVFEDTPFWTSSLSERSTSVEAGDLDGDGFLDLVFGNFETANTVYTGYGDSISTAPTWQSDSTKITWEIALGDVNGDGLLDLLCANKGELILAQENYLYLNENGSLATSPAWISAQTNNSSGAELADIDGDGDLDAIFGNTDQRNTIYINDGGTLRTDPSWTSIPANRTYVAAPVDVDSDGDLDITFANSGDWPDGEINTLFRNVTGPFSYGSMWTAAASYTVRSIEYLDIDSDGDLDLAFGCNGQPNILFINDDGVLGTSASWSSGLSATTFSIAAGDIDGDGDPDLVCGNLDEPDNLYINDNGVLRTDPLWSSSASQATWSVTLADFDGDGDLDLACGHLNQANAVYMNTGGTFETEPSWTSTPESGTWRVTSGDIDGNGLPDLVCGNSGFSGENNSVYFSYTNGIERTPSWVSAQANRTWSLALGDVDGDGDLDLACGNIDQHNTIYINDGGALSTDPGWSSALLNTTRAIVFEDADGDGDLDLACGNYSQADVVYFNDGNLPAENPGWSSTLAGATCDIEIADVDLDGDPDLTVGLYGQPSTAFGGLANPAFRGDPTAPTGNRPQNSAFISRARIDETSENLYTIEMTLSDVESDPVFVIPTYRYRGESDIRPVFFTGRPTPAGPLTTSPQGTVHSFEWDVSLLPLDNREVTLLLTLIEVPARVATMRHMPIYRLEAGPVMPSRPVITTPSGPLEFATVTVGDSVTSILLIDNTGNAPLSISSIDLPSPEMRIETILPIVVPPLDVFELPVYLEPVLVTQVSGSIDMTSNDPASPVHQVVVAADIRTLTVSSRLLKPEWQDEVEPDEALTVIVTPAPQVRVETGILSYRITGELQWRELQLSPSQDDFIAIIPGGHVTEAGLEYYIEVRNEPVVSTDPEGAPEDSTFSVLVLPPEWVNALALENSGEGYLEGRQIRVLASLQPGSVITDGTLYFRKGGEAVYEQTPLDLQLDPPSALIPDTFVTAAGIEYWLEVNTLSRTLTSPAVDPAGSPGEIRVTVPELAEEGAWSAEKYRIFSVPLEFSADFSGTIEALLSDQKEFGPYDPVKWRSFAYLPSTGGYTELSGSSSEHFRPRPGRAFWLVCRSRSRIDTAPVTGYSTGTSAPWRITLSPGWNMAGHPFSFPVEWDSMMVDTMSMDEAEMVLVEPPVSYSGTGYRYDTSVLDPFAGYWINNLTDSNVTLNIPARQYGTAAAAPPREIALAPGDGWLLRIGISAFSAGARDMDGCIGIHDDASAVFDRMDRSCPPPGPGGGISVYFPQKDGSRLHRDVRGTSDGLREIDLSAWLEKNRLPEGFEVTLVSGEIWGFDVSRTFPGIDSVNEVVLDFDVAETAARDLGIFLVDRELRTIVDLRLSGTYSFFSGRRGFIVDPDGTRFAIIAGTDKYIEDMEDLSETPGSTALVGNYPNPFNPLTVIRYDLADASVVTIRIFDVRGALVKTLLQARRTPGRYEITWNGRTETGFMASSGIFFCLMETDRGFRETRKLVLLH